MMGEQEAAALSIRRGTTASHLPQSEKKDYIASQGKDEVAGKGDAKAAQNDFDTRNQLAVQGSMKHGGPVKKTGLYKLHEGEHVVAKEEKGKEGKSKGKMHAGHGYHKTEIEHHEDGSHTIRHHPHPDHMGEKPEKSYAVADLPGVHEGLEANLGTPNPGEAEADAGQSGMPAAGAAPAPGAPAAGAASAPGAAA